MTEKIKAQKAPIEIKFPVKSLRKIPNPYIGEEVEFAAQTHPMAYIAMCDVTKLPNNIPMETNPREQKLTTFVAKGIRNTLMDVGSPYFFLMNRGILLSAKSVSYNNYNNELSVVFEDPTVHGNVDGGHTYKIIQQCKDSLGPDQQYVRLEILTGVESIFQDLAGARNTSVQVKDQSLAELENKFDIVKDALKNEPFASRLVYKENDERGDIDVMDVLAVLNMFNIDQYDGKDVAATISYSGKKRCLDTYLSQYKAHKDSPQNPYVKMKNIMVDIFKLYDQIEVSMADFYRNAVTNGKYGAIKGVVPFEGAMSKYYQKPMDYMTPTGFIYPILGAFRALVVEKDGVYSWRDGVDPFKILERVGSDLVLTTVERSRSLGNNPQSTGKDAGHWKTLYMTVGFEALNG